MQNILCTSRTTKFNECAKKFTVSLTQGFLNPMISIKNIIIDVILDSKNVETTVLHNIIKFTFL